MSALGTPERAVWAHGLTPCPRHDLPSSRQVEICRRWLRAWCKPRKTLNERHSSYGLKHVAENWADEYVTNGAFIAAAIAEGYRIQPTRHGGPNAVFNIAIAKEALRPAAQKQGRDAIRDLLRVKG